MQPYGGRQTSQCTSRRWRQGRQKQTHCEERRAGRKSEAEAELWRRVMGDRRQPGRQADAVNTAPRPLPYIVARTRCITLTSVATRPALSLINELIITYTFHKKLSTPARILWSNCGLRCNQTANVTTGAASVSPLSVCASSAAAAGLVFVSSRYACTSSRYA